MKIPAFLQGVPKQDMSVALERAVKDGKIDAAQATAIAVKLNLPNAESFKAKAHTAVGTSAFGTTNVKPNAGAKDPPPVSAKCVAPGVYLPPIDRDFQYPEVARMGIIPSTSKPAYEVELKQSFSMSAERLAAVVGQLEALANDPVAAERLLGPGWQVSARPKQDPYTQSFVDIYSKREQSRLRDGPDRADIEVRPWESSDGSSPPKILQRVEIGPDFSNPANTGSTLTGRTLTPQDREMAARLKKPAIETTSEWQDFVISSPELGNSYLDIRAETLRSRLLNTQGGGNEVVQHHIMLNAELRPEDPKEFDGLIGKILQHILPEESTPAPPKYAQMARDLGLIK
jgi:hypothetical protein